MMEQKSKEKFVLVQQDDILYDEGLKTKSIGYYKDAWLRFKKNKAQKFYISFHLIEWLKLVFLKNIRYRKIKSRKGINEITKFFK